jgi:UDP-N-acetylmuramoylalanine--D-glutamate ligase
MPSRPPLPAGPFLVVGLARSGEAVARLLAGMGETVIGVDSGAPESAAGLEQAGVEVHLNMDGNEFTDRVQTLVKSPGVPQDAPAVVAARERGIDVAGELEIAWRVLPNRFVAVTGTNGKTTTTELIAHLLRAAGEDARAAGNVGTPLATLKGIVESETIVAECSSFQLEDTIAFAPEVAVFLNLAPDHLDRHGTLEDYLEAKLRVFANQGAGDIAVVNAAETALIGRDLGEAELITFDPRDRGAGDVTIVAGEIRWQGNALLRSAELQLLGPHNVSNAMAAAATVLALGADPVAVAGGLRSFEAVPHRLEPVGAHAGVLYVNDSKATNVAAAIAAVNSFESGAHVILGGSGKGESYVPLTGPLIERAVGVYLVGETAEKMEAELAGPLAAAGIPTVMAGDLESAVRAAASAAVLGQVVLLAPAAASFDAYRDYEERGEDFRRIAGGLG